MVTFAGGGCQISGELVEVYESLARHHAIRKRENNTCKIWYYFSFVLAVMDRVTYLMLVGGVRSKQGNLF